MERADLALDGTAAVVELSVAHRPSPRWFPRERTRDAGDFAGGLRLTDVGSDKSARPEAHLITESANGGADRDGPRGLFSVFRLRQPHVFDTDATSQQVQALNDLIEGVRNWRLWSMMGWLEIRQRYRRSALGPFWLTLSMAVTVVTLGVLYGSIFSLEISSYMPFMCLGMVCWEFVSKTLFDACKCFLDLEHLIKQIRLPLSVHVAAVVWRNVAILAHNIAIFALVAVAFGIWPGLNGLLVLPGLLLIIANLFWMAMLLALTCARFRDVPQVVMTAIQLLFFVTPVFWKPEMLKSLSFVVTLNPFFHMIQLVRAPLLGQAPDAASWIVMVTLMIVGWAVTFSVFSRFRKRVTYWL